MNIGKTIFDQLMDFVPIYEEFQICVDRCNGNHKVISQLACQDSLRDIAA